MRIRVAESGDAAALACIYAPFVRDTVISFECEAPDAEEMRVRMVEIGADYPWLVAEEKGRIAGYVYASPHRARPAYIWSADVTAYLHPDFHRQGLGKRLYTALFAILRQQGFHSLYAGIALPNPASIALHRVMGMHDIGIYREVGFKFGAWRDVLWMGLAFEGDPLPLKPPMPFQAVGTEAIRPYLNI